MSNNEMHVNGELHWNHTVSHSNQSKILFFIIGQVYLSRGENEEAEVIEVRIWNDTVANLTLMALGSSAPEILLSIIEIIKNDFHAGELGPGAIVGSAAFNLLCISAVCVASIPHGETRLIKGSLFTINSCECCFMPLQKKARWFITSNWVDCDIKHNETNTTL